MANPLSLIQETPAAQNISSFLAQLPKQKWLGDDVLYQWQGSWYSATNIESIIAFHSNFEASNDDIILASPPKSGTTWLKALVSTIIHGRDMNDEEGDPLLTKNPHSIVETLECNTFYYKSDPDLSSMPAPRIFHTHLPYHSLPDSMKKSPCKIVYVARNPKDTFASLYHFMNTFSTPEQGPYPIDQVFENFCNGVHPFGPSLDHIMEYWNESLKKPEKIKFLKYEELKGEPKKHVRMLAEYLDKPFSVEEEVDQVIHRCSIERLKNLEVNMNGTLAKGWSHTIFFRRGVVGDWRNILTKEMSERLDQVTHSKLAGSGLNFSV